MFCRRRIRMSTIWRISSSRPVTGSISSLRAFSVRSTAKRLSASCLPICAGAIEPLASPGAAALKPSLARRPASGEPAVMREKSSHERLELDALELPRDRHRAHCAATTSSTCRPAGGRCGPGFRRTAACRRPSRARPPSSMCGDRSDSAVAPRGRRSIASVTSFASTAASTSKWRRIRCRSESCSCRIWLSQWTNSTYGLPRSLANTVAPSIAL